MITQKNWLTALFISLFLITLSACGGGGAGVPEPPVAAADECVTEDEENDDDNCGPLLVGLTDAEGDFLNYSVSISGLDLMRNDGMRVSVMPTAQMVNFVDYIELSELATAATVPAGVYRSGSITVDYTDASIQVEKNGVAVDAMMVDENGQPLLSQTLQLEFDQDNRLIIARHRPAMLELDFNLSASHTVNLEADPVTVTTEPFLTAEVDPVMSKEFRMRGPLIRVVEDESLFRIAVRPFHRMDGRFGGVNVTTNEETNFEINGEGFSGAAGLAQMATLAEGTPSVSFGVFNRAEDNFTASMVLAGSSVPGSDKDAARGVIVAREGNTLTVRGASLIRRDGRVDFNDQINVLIGENTLVGKPRRIHDEVSIDDLSVGQAVTVLGEISETDTGFVLDATEGAIRMRLTFASGHVVEVDDAGLTMDLQALQGRLPEVYDFSGTGIDETFDADPDAYEVTLGDMNNGGMMGGGMNGGGRMVTDLAVSDPVRVSGFVSAFGTAPPDFDAMTVIDYSQSRSQLFIDWPDGDDVLAFSEISTEQLVINIVNEGEGGVYKLIQGGIRTDLTTFDSAVSIQPLGERGIYTLRSGDTVSAFSNFADFVAMLQLKLDEGEVIDGLHAMGGFSHETRILSALKIAVKLD